MSASLDMPLNEKLYKNILTKINKCFTNMQRYIKDFNPCCSSLAEKNVIKKSINIAKQHTTYSEEVIYCSVFIYYYSSIVVEYNANGVDEYCYNTLKREYGGKLKVNELITQITTSDEGWASQIRQLINNMNQESFAGGKFKRKRSKRKYLIRKKSKSKRRKTKRLI